MPFKPPLANCDFVELRARLEQAKAIGTPSGREPLFAWGSVSLAEPRP